MPGNPTKLCRNVCKSKNVCLYRNFKSPSSNRHETSKHWEVSRHLIVPILTSEEMIQHTKEWSQYQVNQETNSSTYTMTWLKRDKVVNEALDSKQGRESALVFYHKNIDKQKFIFTMYTNNLKKNIS